MKKLFFLSLLLPLLALGQTTTVKVMDAGPGIGKYNWVEYDPPGMTASSKLPVFVMFPGNGETGQNSALMYVNGPLKFTKGGWTPGFIIIGAQTPYAGGTFGNPIAIPFVRAVLKELVNGYHGVDTSRIYLTGLSYGADHIVNYMQHETDANFVAPAAAIPMSIAIYGQVGNYPNDALGGTDTRFSILPLWGFCGNSDPGYAAMSHYFSMLTKAGYTNKFTSYSGGHSGWNTYYDPNYKESGLNIYDWALQYSRKSTTVTPPPVTTPPVVVPARKTLVSVTTTYLYADSTKETIIKP